MVRAEMLSVRARISGVVWALVIAIPLIVLGAPRLLAEFSLIPTHAIIADLAVGRSRERVHLEAVVRATEVASRWVESGRVYADRATGELVLAAYEGQINVDLVDEGRRDLERGLVLAPMNPFAWFRLASAELEIRGGEPDAAVVGALMMSVHTGPLVGSLLVPRSEFALRIWEYLDSANRAVFSGQFAAALRRSAARFAAMVVQLRREVTVAAALAGDGPAALNFLSQVRRVRRR